MLGLEQSAPLVEAADRRRHQLSAEGLPGCPACLRVVRCQVSDSESGQQQLQRLAADFTADQCSCGTVATARQPAGWCLTGLHCCGDLAPQLLRLLLRLPESRALLLLSCCYHKAADGDLLSRRLAAARLGPFGRRLACQQSVAAWCRQTAAEHRRHAAAAGWRALLQAVAERTGRSVSERRRHGTHRYASFAQYAAAMLEPESDQPRTDISDQLRTDGENQHQRGTDSGDQPRTDISDQLRTDGENLHQRRTDSGDQPRTDSGDQQQLQETDNGDQHQQPTDTGDQRLRAVAAAVSDQYAPQLLCVEFLAALQTCLQPVLEGVLLIDRMLFLREHALSAELVPLFDDRLSPRAWALVARKR